MIGYQEFICVLKSSWIKRLIQLETKWTKHTPTYIHEQLQTDICVRKDCISFNLQLIFMVNTDNIKHVSQKYINKMCINIFWK